jgi:ABC-type transporter Mla MlaB component
MAKGDSSVSFLSKVARFVRHPTVDWTELDARTAGVDEEREALKAAIQRKRRNDQVRHRELNALRELMRQQRAHPPQADAAVADEAVSVPPSSGLGVDKSRTIEQIARIEEQMSAHWLQRRADEAAGDGLRIGSGTTIPARLDGGVTVPAHLQARAGELPTFPMTIDLVTEDPNAGVTDWDGALSHPAIAEAAVRFANGQADETEQSLRALMVQEALSPVAQAAGGLLLDALYARGDLEGFEEFAAEHAERFGGPVPRWPVLASSAPVAVAPPVGAGPAVHSWTCPLLLDAACVAELHRLVSQPGGHKWLDWTDLVSAALPAAQALLSVVEVWLQRPIEFHFRGGAVLRRRLKASTPSGRRENDSVWWLLRLALLRLMRRRDEFDLAALDYCVTYGVLPPDWQEPVCRFEVAEAVPAGVLQAPAAAEVPALASEPIHPLDTQLAGLDVLEWPAMVTTVQEGDAPVSPASAAASRGFLAEAALRPGMAVALAGVLQGDIPQALQSLDAALQAHPLDRVFRIDGHALHRVDFAAAGSLLQWFMATTARGLKVELVGVSRLVGAFFHVVGIDEAVTVRLRQY